MPILAVNAGSSSLKFARHPRADASHASSAIEALADPILTGHAQGLEPGGRPRLERQRGGPVIGG